MENIKIHQIAERKYVQPKERLEYEKRMQPLNAVAAAAKSLNMSYGRYVYYFGGVYENPQRRLELFGERED